MQHPNEGTIHAWLDGALDAEEAARVEEHVAQCATCSAAVAEARGLVAGASRILGALDYVPGDVTPRSAAFDARAQATRRSRSLWGALHLTPARAAAAALIFIAAGTALVVRQANEPRPMPNDAVTLSTAPRADTIASLGAVGGAPANGVASSSAEPPAAPSAAPRAPAPAPVAQRAPRGAAFGKRSETQQVSAPIAMSKTVEARAAAAPVLDSTLIKPQRLTVSAADSVVAKSAVRDSLAQAASDLAARAQARYAAPVAASRAVGGNADAFAGTSYSGCYDVVTDTIAGLPRRLSLDATPFSRESLRERRVAAGVAGMQRVQQYGVSALDSVRRPLAGSYWQNDLAGGVLVSLGEGAPAPGTMRLRTISSDVLAGTLTIAGRDYPITLRRVKDCRR